MRAKRRNITVMFGNCYGREVAAGTSLLTGGCTGVSVCGVARSDIAYSLCARGHFCSLRYNLGIKQLACLCRTKPGLVLARGDGF